MAQPITCDGGHDDPVLADVMVSRLDGSSTLAFCDPCYLAVARAIVDNLDQAERDAADAAALAALEASRTAPDPGTAHVVPRGASRSRKAHEARQRARETPEAVPVAYTAVTADDWVETEDQQREADLAAIAED